jgi:hypothetical protein
MELKLDKTTKILLGAIALGLFLNASEVIITKAMAMGATGYANEPINIVCVRGCGST